MSDASGSSECDGSDGDDSTGDDPTKLCLKLRYFRYYPLYPIMSTNIVHVNIVDYDK